MANSDLLQIQNTTLAIVTPPDFILPDGWKIEGHQRHNSVVIDKVLFLFSCFGSYSCPFVANIEGLSHCLGLSNFTLFKCIFIIHVCIHRLRLHDW